ncbi:hypothetical protein ACQEV2_02175 [Streptomyces sp. CA-251387]|uniref:hypothetical protein n=1 Tax=Streptomyces sp. CA-251387 TaxID=3240064 RepID=UPI003D8D7A40
MPPPTAELEHQDSTVLTGDERRTPDGDLRPWHSRPADGQDERMDGVDPHIHVEQSVTRHDPRERNLLAGAFGLVGDLPETVATGCGLKVPYAMTSTRPESVTCLACREHGSTQHLLVAEEIERLGSMPGSVITGAQASLVAEHHGELARRFGGGS